MKFGVSPFGIYRNQKTAPNIGSATSGLQNYDDLYADVLLWVNNGWVDYVVPQIYWQIGHPAADYETLITWWNKYAGARHLYIGEDVERTVKYPDPGNKASHQLAAKRRLHARMRNVNGTVLWYAKAVVDNVGNYGAALRTAYWRTPALPPRMPFIDDKAPKKPRKVTVLNIDNDKVLFWTPPKAKHPLDEAVRYVVYRFGANETIDLDDATKIVTVTANTFYKLPQMQRSGKVTYVVTALDRMSNESRGVKKRVSL